jgi:hypothetical protein
MVVLSSLYSNTIIIGNRFLLWKTVAQYIYDVTPLDNDVHYNLIFSEEKYLKEYN